ncbi:hypothetical protein WISP_135241 [Willisornis vidua]|uniref:Ig-like domain-containing protein n=1 Tax=Willisornis vidua TaxID=1566151 RepID=A0ABQ9CTP2_9PASS|nr:hypothetical protein WISP_135241 [Willisornis vidua]
MLSYVCMNWILLVLFTGPTVSDLVVKGEVGQNVTVPCTYSVRHTTDITSMCWGRDSCPNSQCSRTIIWTDGWRVTEQHSSRYLLQGNLLEGDVSLTIVSAEEGDSGTYCCRVEHRGWFNDQKTNLKVVIKKARISTASPHTYTSEQTSVPGSTSESFTITDTWTLVSASEAPQTNMSVLLPSQQYSENVLYIGIGSCAVLLVILILALYLTKQLLKDEKGFLLPPLYLGKSQRYDLQGSVFSGDVSLTIGTVEAEDAGVYCCRVEIPGWFNDIKQNIWLEVARVTTEFPHTLLTEEGSTSAEVSVMMEEVPNTGVSANSDGKAEKHDDSRDKFHSSVILIACVIAGAVLFVLMFSLFWKRKHAKKLIMKSSPGWAMAPLGNNNLKSEHIVGIAFDQKETLCGSSGLSH